MNARRPVEEVVADPATPEHVRTRLEASGAILAFAHESLLLPDNGSYRQYADVGRPFVVWNVFAAPEFSVEPRSWCFLVVGCTSYRGYFDPDRAAAFAAERQAAGDDSFIGGVSAYSTLGRFADPLINTMMGLPEAQLAGLVFHELAHQKLYVKDDSSFNESFASFMEVEGLRRWLGANGTSTDLCHHGAWLERRAQARALLDGARSRLARIYASDLPETEKRERKARVFDELNERYLALRANWLEPPWFDGWFGDGLNNARLVALAVYDIYVPAFALLLEREDGNLEAFYRRAKALGALPPDERRAGLEKLSGEAAVRRSGARPAGNCPAPLAVRRPGDNRQASDRTTAE